MKARNMSSETAYFLSQDGLKLHYRYWLPEDATNVVCLVHGLGEHGDRYIHVGDFLYKNNSAVFAMDLRGHGHSQGKKGHARNYNLLLTDIEELLKTARAECTDQPLFLFGHSMGGNLVANYMIKMNTNDITGFILSAPWFNLAFDPPRWKVKLGSLVTRMIPSFSQPSGLIANYLSRDPHVVETYTNDPLVHNKISAGLYTSISKAGSYALDHAGKIKTDGLVYHGNGDKIIDWESSKQFAQLCNAEWHELQEVYHEPHNDLGKEQVLNFLFNWIAAKTKNRNPIS